MPTYTNSKGVAVEIASMEYRHLVNSHAKAVRELDLIENEDDRKAREVEIHDMAVEIAKRDAAYAAEQAEAEGEGDV